MKEKITERQKIQIPATPDDNALSYSLRSLDTHELFRLCRTEKTHQSRLCRMKKTNNSHYALNERSDASFSVPGTDWANSRFPKSTIRYAAVAAIRGRDLTVTSPQSPGIQSPGCPLPKCVKNEPKHRAIQLPFASPLSSPCAGD